MAFRLPDRCHGSGPLSHFGEGKYEETERRLQELLRERNGQLEFRDAVTVQCTGAEAPPDSDVQSPETYVGNERADNFISAGGIRKDVAYRSSIPDHLELNQWGLSGEWTDGPQVPTLSSVPDRIVYRFHARDVHLVLGTRTAGKAVRFRVTIDGKAPGESHGVDTDTRGSGTVTEHRLNQLIRQKGAVDDRTFQIEFLDAGAQVFAFTFG